jgi:hypothetical protein
MKKLFVKTAIATALLSAGLMAQALTVSGPKNLGTLAPSGTAFLWNLEAGFFGSTSGVNFYDEFVFTLGGSNTKTDITFAASAIPDIPGFGFSLYSNTLGATYQFSGSNLANPWGSTSPITSDGNGGYSLDPGIYTLQVSGQRPDFAFYAVGADWNTVTVTPVPEPETYGMLIAGLGLVGFIATRRRKAAALLAA